MSNMQQPTCGRCGLPMTPENARIHPEYFLHDACRPADMRPPEPVLRYNEYLGDGVYVAIEDGRLLLTTGSHRVEEAENRIYLEPEVMAKLVAYWERFKK